MLSRIRFIARLIKNNEPQEFHFVLFTGLLLYRIWALSTTVNFSLSR